MNKIEKFLNKLGKEVRSRIEILIMEIVSGNFAQIKFKKLKGFKDLYSTREGKIRIIFRKETTQNAIINVAYRKDVYKEV